MRYLDKKRVTSEDILAAGGGITDAQTVAVIDGVTVVTHNLGVKARLVEFLVADEQQIFNWKLNAGDPLNKIDILSTEAEAAVDVNIIGY